MAETGVRDNWKEQGRTATGTPFGDATGSLNRLQDIVGRKWHPHIVYHLRADGTMGFSDLKSAVDGISSKMLSEGLDDLEAMGIVERELVNDQPVRVAYSLTEAGDALEGIISDLVQWEQSYHDGDADESDTVPDRPVVADGGQADAGDEDTLGGR